MADNTPIFITKKQLLSILPYLEKARWRLMLRPYFDRHELGTHDFFPEYFAPPGSPEEEKIMILADLAAGLLFDIHKEIEEGKITDLINKALPEIEQAYNVIKRKGGGWGRKANKKKRQEAAIQWFNDHQARLSYLKKSYLEDTALYDDRGGQEKRDFRVRLTSKIVIDNMNERLTTKEIMSHLRCLDNLDETINDFISSILKRAAEVK